MGDITVTKYYLSQTDYADIAEWCIEQFGIPATPGRFFVNGHGWSLSRRLDDYYITAIANFDTEEKAMAFKLRWL